MGVKEAFYVEVEISLLAEVQESNSIGTPFIMMPFNPSQKDQELFTPGRPHPTIRDWGN